MEIRFKKIEDLPKVVKEHIRELNIQFAKRHETFAMPINEYNNVAVEKRGVYTIYCDSNFERRINSQHYLSGNRLFVLCNAIVDTTNGICVVKNRWGNTDS